MKKKKQQTCNCLELRRSMMLRNPLISLSGTYGKRGNQLFIYIFFGLNVPKGHCWLSRSLSLFYQKQKKISLSLPPGLAGNYGRSGWLVWLKIFPTNWVSATCHPVGPVLFSPSLPRSQGKNSSQSSNQKSECTTFQHLYQVRRPNFDDASLFTHVALLNVNLNKILTTLNSEFHRRRCHLAWGEMHT